MSDLNHSARLRNCLGSRTRVAREAIEFMHGKEYERF